MTSSPQKPHSSAPSPRILVVSPTYFAAESVLGGAERYVLGFSRAMAQQTPTTLLSFGPRAIEKKDGTLRTRVLKTQIHIGGSKLNPLAWGLLGEITKHDIVHCHQIHTLATELCLGAGALLRKKVFLTDHGGGGRTLLTRFGIQRCAAGLLSVSRYAANKGEIPGLSTEPIYGGIDIHRFSPPTSPKSVSSSTAFQITSIGRFLPHKGFHHLIRACKTLSNYELTLAGSTGSPEYLKSLRELAQNLPIRFIENASDEELISLLQKSQLTVYPSTRIGPKGEPLLGEPELFGQAPLEAMSCGVPALVSDVGSYPEIALPQAPALTFKDDAARAEDSLIHKLNYLIHQFLQDQALLESLGKRAREHVIQNFTWDAVIQRCLSFYEKHS